MEYRFRRLIPITSEQYLQEAAVNVHWFLQFDKLDQDRAAVEQRRADAELEAKLKHAG